MEKSCYEDYKKLFAEVQRKVSWNNINGNSGETKIQDRFEKEKDDGGVPSTVAYTKLSNGLFLIEDEISGIKRIAMQPVEIVVVGRDEEIEGQGSCGLGGFEISLVYDIDKCGLQINDEFGTYAGVIFHEEEKRDYAILPNNLWDAEQIQTGFVTTDYSQNAVAVAGEEVRGGIEEFLQEAISALKDKNGAEKLTRQVYEKALELLQKVQEFTRESTVTDVQMPLFDAIQSEFPEGLPEDPELRKSYLQEAIYNAMARLAEQQEQIEKYGDNQKGDNGYEL